VTGDQVVPTIAQALAAAAADVGPIGKDATNDEQGFAFRSMEGIMSAAGPALTRHGVVMVPELLNTSVETLPRGRNGTPWRLVTITVRFSFVGPAGDWLAAVTSGEGFDPGDKATMKAWTSARKAAMLTVLAIADTDDPDRTTPPDAHVAAPPSMVRRAEAKGQLLAACQGHADVAGEWWRLAGWEHVDTVPTDALAVLVTICAGTHATDDPAEDPQVPQDAPPADTGTTTPEPTREELVARARADVAAAAAAHNEGAPTP
jgi:hypothetical protein